MGWFRCNAPIRLKLAIVFGVYLGLLTLMLIVGTTMSGSARIVSGLILIAAAAGLAYWFREAIAGPYVSTVLRMEALAAGDLDAPIAYTDYTDCVGRMTKAMFTFKQTAAEQISLNRIAQEQGEIVRGMEHNLRLLADGDLCADITADFPGEYAALKKSYNDALFMLRDLMGSVIQAAQSVRAGAHEIASASESLAKRAEGNAASLEQTNASTTEMTERIRASAIASKATVTHANDTANAVASGRRIVDDAMRAMERVSVSAAGTTDVIEGLDKIAFQTRVLAMNAAVEAGRAGAAGSGFAVVADLVSALAMRAEEEARRAREQLSVAQEEANSAVDAVQKVDIALNDISEAATKVHTLLDDLAKNNDANAGSVQEIGAAIAQMDRSTQQNAAMVEETSAAARTLDSEASNLLARTSTFNITPKRKVADARRDFTSSGMSVLKSLAST